MESVVRALVVYAVLLAVFRLAGKRTLAQITPFDFVLLLIIAEAVQPALTGSDTSMQNSLFLVLTLIAVDFGLSLLTNRWQTLERLVEGDPLVLVEDGQPIREHLRRARVNEHDILAAARMNQGLERMDQIRFAILERSGGISIVPKASEAA